MKQPYSNSYIQFASVPPLCDDIKCLNNGTCDDTSGQAECSCPIGYSGVRCESQILECGATNCHDDFTRNCYNTSGTLQCECVLGYVGQFCDDGIISFILKHL